MLDKYGNRLKRQIIFYEKVNFRAKFEQRETKTKNTKANRMSDFI